MEFQIIHHKIHDLRGHKVILDFDLAELYDVPTKAFKQAVRRNMERFPKDFMFELTRDEYNVLRSQIVTLEHPGKGKYSKYLPFAFTEHGVAMLSSVLNSDLAVQTNIAIIRAFIELRHYSFTYVELAQKIADMEARTGKELADINDVLRWLGEENQARYDEIQALHMDDVLPRDWSERARIGF
ncbi:MAG: ORF6N domain-containing protein [Saprospiraceae bacterium]|nr:ORF6N domain-containing protein [Saprospiraceae bacterium]